MEIDQGKLSTILITVATIVLGFLVANPDIISQYVDARYVALVMSIIVSIYNYLKPRNPEAVEPVFDEEDTA